MYTKETVNSGAMVEVTKRVKQSRPSGRRAGRSKPTKEDQRRRNARRRKRLLEQRIVRNFKNGDWWITLTFRLAVGKKKMQKTLKSFFQILRREYGETAQRYLYCTEKGGKTDHDPSGNIIHTGGRWHAHLLMPKEIEFLDIKDAWKRAGKEAAGRAYADAVNTLPDAAGLAAYMLKEADRKAPGERAYSKGAAIIDPETHEEEISAKVFRRQPADKIKIKGKTYKLAEYELYDDPFTLENVLYARYFAEGAGEWKTGGKRHGKNASIRHSLHADGGRNQNQKKRVGKAGTAGV